MALPAGTQHLLGVVNFLDVGLAAVDSAKATPALRGLLQEHGYRILELPEYDESKSRRGMNFVAVGPSKVLMPSDCPGNAAALKARGSWFMLLTSAST